MWDSGIRWIGEIPKEWNLNRIKYMATLKGRIGWQGLTAEEYQDDGACLITGVDFLNGGINWNTCVHVPIKRWEEAKDIQIKDGDLLITKDGTIGKVAIVTNMPRKTSLNSGVLRIMPLDGFSRRFLYWVLQSEEFWNWFNYRNAGNSTIIHLYQGDFAEFIYAFPEYRQQEKIADFLDFKCAKLDKLLNVITEQIETLHKYRKSIIAKTLTVGLNKSVSLKDSGVNWIGKIPVHWVAKKIKYTASYIGSGTTPLSGDISFYENGTINWIQSGDLYGRSYIDDTESKITKLALLQHSALKILNAPYIVIAMYGASVGNVAISKISACSNQACCSIMPDNKNDLLFLYYWLVFCKDDFLAKSIGGGQPNISQSIIKDEVFIQPPLSEQIEIGKLLNEKCRIVDSIIAKKEQQLDLVKKHKLSLIFEYITGKKQVLGVQN